MHRSRKPVPYRYTFCLIILSFNFLQLLQIPIVPTYASLMLNPVNLSGALLWVLYSIQYTRTNSLLGDSPNAVSVSLLLLPDFASLSSMYSIV